MGERMTRIQQCRCGKRVRDLAPVTEDDETVLLCRECAPRGKPAALRPITKEESRRGWWTWLRTPEPHVTAKQRRALEPKGNGRGPSQRGWVHVTSSGNKISAIKRYLRQSEFAK